jgi:hypothetical protein
MRFHGFFGKFFLICLVSYFPKTSFEAFMCERSYYNECLIETEQSGPFYCQTNETYSSLTYFSPSRQVLDSNLHLYNSNCSVYAFIFSNFRAIDLTTKLSSALLEYDIYVYYSEFKFIQNDEYAHEFNQSFFRTINNSINFGTGVNFNYNVTKNIFRNAEINLLYFQGLKDSKVSKNQFRFKENYIIHNLNSSIFNLVLHVFKISFDQYLLACDVFKKIHTLEIKYVLEKVEENAFENLKDLKFIAFRLLSLRNLYERSLKWMRRINQDIRISLENFTSNGYDPAYILIEQISMNPVFSLILNDYTYPDEDFCAFKSFPHQQYIFPILSDCFNSCTFYWLTQYHSFFDPTITNFFCDISNISQCDFKKMLAKCSIFNHFVTINEKETDIYLVYDQYSEIKKYDFVFSIVLFPIICSFGFVLNLLSIFTLMNKKFQKSFKDRMYKQMLLNSILNLFICFIHLFRITIKCIDPLSSFCIINLLTNKYYRIFVIILTNYIGNVLRTCSNFLHITVTLDRFIKSTDFKCDVFKKYTTSSLKLIYSLLLSSSLLLNSVRLFQFDYNLSFDNFLYPIISKDYFNMKYVVAYLNILNVILSKCAFIFIQIIIDIFLLFFIRKSIRIKIRFVLIGEMSSTNKIRNQSNKMERSVKLMMIVSSFVLFLTHTPDLLISIYMAMTFRSIVDNVFKESLLFSLFYFSISENIYFLSYSFNFFFYYFFNNNFRIHFKSLIGSYN